jgi:hypothetical protein
VSRFEVRIITDSTGLRRVVIYHREAGTFGFEEQRFSDVPEERCWLSVGRRSEAVCPTEELAVREAQGRVSWLAGAFYEATTTSTRTRFEVT